MSDNETQKPWGGKRDGAGRPKGTTLPKEKRTSNKSVTLTNEEWDKLATLGQAEAPPISQTIYASKIIRNFLEGK